MGVRSLKDLDKIQEKGHILLSASRARTLVFGVSGLVVIAFLVGLQVGRSFAPVEGEVVAQDVAAADRTIEEILAVYRATGAPHVGRVVEAATPAPVQEPMDEPTEDVTQEPPAEPSTPDPAEDAVVAVDPPIVLSPPIPSVPVVPPDLPEVAQDVVVDAVVDAVVDEIEVEEPPTETVDATPFASLPRPGSRGGYAVQLAAFPTSAEADSLAAVVRTAGAQVYTMEVEVRGETWHRVRVGRFSRRADAQAWLPDLTAMTPFEPIVVAE